MKIRLSLLLMMLISITSCGLPTASSGKTSTVLGAKSKAIEYLSSARVNTSASEFYNSITQIRNILYSTPIILEYPTDNGACSDDIDGFTLAYVQHPAQDSDIYLCSVALDNSNEVVAQVLIHEAAHITGITVECAATYIATHIVHYAGDQPFENGYVATCPPQYDFSRISFSTFSETATGWNPVIVDPRARY